MYFLLMITLVVMTSAAPVPGGHGGGAVADGAAWASPGVVAGNNIQVPVHVPVNACGITVAVTGIVNPALGSTCFNN